MNTPHKHQEYINAWAAGKTIQRRSDDDSFGWDGGYTHNEWWTYPPGVEPNWDAPGEFRIAPVKPTLSGWKQKLINACLEGRKLQFASVRTKGWVDATSLMNAIRSNKLKTFNWYKKDNYRIEPDSYLDLPHWQIFLISAEGTGHEVEYYYNGQWQRCSYLHSYVCTERALDYYWGDTVKSDYRINHVKPKHVKLKKWQKKLIAAISEGRTVEVFTWNESVKKNEWRKAQGLHNSVLCCSDLLPVESFQDFFPSFIWREKKYYRIKDEHQVKPEFEIPEGFTPWVGGDCPVDPKCIVEVIYRTGRSYTEPASPLRWEHNDECGDIIAYKVVKKEPVVRWQWIFEAMINFNGEKEWFLCSNFFTEDEAIKYSNRTGHKLLDKFDSTKTEFDE